ncbi:type IV toxin-antitoxin system AbiEi family antitoxin domain-containing protein [Deinococcus planocerae]|uniref:type IV toxin-antitoxin system AbiEi family antitoxin domain-containing protein n=1 Tax=Deinococcus planocerae TaxID=1737569 RepID=UPI0015E15786|nr:type IV toxin-antitoxin system AbiEi family antitoxin domain-containing protein [Deinococcus planocerae]
MSPPSHQSRAQQLFELADAQARYFTARQALDLGYAYPTQHHYQRVGHWQRAGHGLYRLTAYPITEHEQLAGLTLWSRTRSGETQAAPSPTTPP